MNAAFDAAKENTLAIVSHHRQRRDSCVAPGICVVARDSADAQSPSGPFAGVHFFRGKAARNHQDRSDARTL
jgi:hypothetical protein